MEARKRTQVQFAGGEMASMADAAASVAQPLKPPRNIPLSKEAMAFWPEIIRARAYSEWGLIELTLAAQLARVMADIESEQARLNNEGSVLENEKGYAFSNPRTSVVSQLVVRQFKYLTALRISGHVAGDPDNLLPGRKAEREAESALKRASGKIRALADFDDEPPLLSL